MLYLYAKQSPFVIATPALIKVIVGIGVHKCLRKAKLGLIYECNE